MEIMITINTDNAAFEDFPVNEVGKILSSYAADLVLGVRSLEEDQILRDSNGNKVGKVEVRG